MQRGSPGTLLPALAKVQDDCRSDAPIEAISRRRFVQLAAAAVAASVLTPAEAALQRGSVRLGLVVPAIAPQFGALNERVIGEAARRGAILAEEDHALATGSSDYDLELLVASGPSDSVTSRAAERLVVAQGIHGLIGGFSETQARELSEMADRHKIPYLNIGSMSDSLRAGSSRYAFHVEASARMYLNALACRFTRADNRRWLLFRSDSEQGVALERSALDVLKGFDVTAEVVIGHHANISLLRQALVHFQPDLILLLLDPSAQLELLGLLRSSDVSGEVIGFPYPLTQTRDYLSIYQDLSAGIGTGSRATLWEATPEVPASTLLDSRFLARWGSPMDPSAWAAYQSVQILLAAATATGTTEGPDLARFLADGPESSFGVAKSERAYFDPTDHQLRQDLYLVQAERGSSGSGSSVRLVSELPSEC